MHPRMSKNLRQDKALIFRITHVDNLEGVIENGCLSRNAAAESNYSEIGNQELILRRNSREVPCHPFGRLSDYVPFYFTPYSPMLYNIKTGYGVPRQPMSKIVILVSSLPKLVKEGIDFVFTDRHAYLRTAQFSNDLSNLDWIIWDVLQKRDFTKTDIDRFEKYQAEALVRDSVPISALLGLVCYDEQTKLLAEKIATEQAVSLDIKTMPGWYL
tara:strand:+ start:1113 stop:1754 length:642 start_codon:yes stop_codon:yes gene_type:complete